MTIRLALFDVDGTLKHEAAWIPGAVDLVTTVADAGIPVALCSGRALASLYQLAEELPGVAHLSGVGGTIVQTRQGDGWRTLAEQYLPPEVVRPLLAELAASGVEVWGYTPDRWLVADRTPMVAWETDATGVVAEVADLAAVPDLVKFVAVPASDAERDACHELAARYPVGVVGSHPRLIDIAPLDAVARKGGDVLVSHLGLDWSQVMAAGDGANDVGLLSAAGLAFLMPPLTLDRLAPGPGERHVCDGPLDAVAILRAR